MLGKEVEGFWIILKCANLKPLWQTNRDASFKNTLVNHSDGFLFPEITSSEPAWCLYWRYVRIFFLESSVTICEPVGWLFWSCSDYFFIFSSRNQLFRKPDGFMGISLNQIPENHWWTSLMVFLKLFWLFLHILLVPESSYLGSQMVLMAISLYQIPEAIGEPVW